MIEAVAPSRLRVRSAAFAASALVVGAICAVLLLLSRVTAYLDQNASPGVNATIERVEIIQRPRPAARARAGAPTRDPSAEPAPTTIPLDRAVLARTVSCLSPRIEDRPPDCPVQFAPHSDRAEFRDPNHRVAESSVGEYAYRYVDPPCQQGLHYDSFTLSGCTRFGRDPPGPTLSAEEICERGGIGPCHPPDMPPAPRLAHTQ